MQAVIRQQLPPDRQQAIAHRAVALLAAASPGDPENPASWAGYAQLAPHVLAAGPLGDYSPPAGSWCWTPPAICGPTVTAPAAEPSRTVLDRWRAVLGPDHPDTLTAASSPALP